MSKTWVNICTALLAAILLSGCANTTYEYTDNTDRRKQIFGEDVDDTPGIFDDVLSRTLGGTEGGGSGLGVNVFLWRAALDTFGFIPLASADPFGGLIITDWYNPPDKPYERVKVTVYILDKRLRADALKVAVFRQTRPTGGGNWQNAAVDAGTAPRLEDAVLTRARELRIKAASRKE